MTKRAIIIGAGPSGSAAALSLARQGIEAIVVERKKVPRTKACGSGLSPWTLSLLDDLGVGNEVRKQAYRIDGAVLAGSTGEAITLRGDHETAILRRSELDQLLVEKAVQAGAQLHDGLTVKEIEQVGHPGRSAMGVTTTNGKYEGDLVIDCSGATGRLDRKVSEPATPQAKWQQTLDRRMLKHRDTLHTIMGWYEGVEGCSDLVELFFDHELRPHYAWIFPETKSRVNIGLCFLPHKGGPNAREHFETFLNRRLEKRLRHATLLGKWIGHPVNVSAAPQRLVSDGVLRAGEAGWLADWATAEGIYHALMSGHQAGMFAAKHLLEGKKTDGNSLLPYQADVQKSLGVRLMGGKALMTGLRLPTLDWVLRMKEAPLTKGLLTRVFTGLYHG